MHYSISNDQNEILHSISSLYLKGKRIHLDLCYNIGSFYSRSYSITAPELKNDLNLPDQAAGITGWDCRNTPLKSLSIRSIIFDPPFLIGRGDDKMTRRYGGYKSSADMFLFHTESLREISRILSAGGILIAKVQDFCHGRQKYFPSVYQVIAARDFGLDLIDSFILMNKNRIRGKYAGTLSSASGHCFFHVYRKAAREKRIARY